ncbi:MAG: MurT ligase domain-containing protein [Propionibacteriaceae bacterium]|jgi:UDP-N-acetylmuramyl tripeptide synthase|nr:MurT ligase domain-containing protein [Propionibacteriaceae bacterium]
MNPVFFVALVAGKLCALLIRILAPRRGTNIPGLIAVKIDKKFLTRVQGIDPAKTIFITGTNGKSTSTNLVVHTLKSAGLSVCSNLEGANMQPGVATALLGATTLGGRFTKDYLVLEIDERSLGLVCADLKPGHLCVMNIQKDQVQRNGEPDYIFQKIRTVVSSLSNLSIYLNNDEPRSLALADSWREGLKVVTFSVAKNSRSSVMEADWGVTMPCPRCHDALEFSHMTIAGMGSFHCVSCGFRSGSAATVIDSVDYATSTFTSESVSYHLAYQAAFFVYSCSLCLCLAAELGVDTDKVVKALESFENIGGRMESFTYSGKEIFYVRIKQENPETLQSAFDTMAEDSHTKVVSLGPDIVSDFVPHYSNTFYTFDCNLEPLISSGVERWVCFGGVTAWDTANRLRYAGVPDDRIVIVDSDDTQQILDALVACKTDKVHLITWMKMYTDLKERAHER